MTDEYAKLEEEALQERRAREDKKKKYVYRTYGRHTVTIDITDYNTIEEFYRLGDELFRYKQERIKSLKNCFKPLQ